LWLGWRTIIGRFVHKRCQHSATAAGPYDFRLQKAASEDFGCTIVTKQHRYIGKGLEN
jgi:hypothetical protein